MIFEDKTNAKIESYKARLGLTGDVYVIGNQIESLESHKRLIPNSIAADIQTAMQERIAYNEAIIETEKLLAKELAEGAGECGMQ